MRLLDVFAAAALVLVIGLPSAAHAAGVTLHWTAPGDDSLAGRATAYDMRYGFSPITSANFVNAMQAQGEPTPAAPGVRETYIVSGLQAGSSYYFAMKTLDNAGNWSTLSNLAYRSLTYTTDVPATPMVLGFSPPRPNPATSAASFVLSLPTAEEVEVTVYDPQGRRVRNLLSGLLPAGETRVSWDLRDAGGARMATGFYLVRARLASATFVRSVVVAR